MNDSTGVTTATTICSKQSSGTLIAKSKSSSVACSSRIKTRNLTKEGLSPSPLKNYYNNTEKPPANFGPYSLKPKKPQNSPLIYSTCQSILNTSSCSSSSHNNSSFYLNPVPRETAKISIDDMTTANKINKELIDMAASSATAKITVIPLPIPSLPPQIQACDDETANSKLSNTITNLSRRTSFADLQKQKLNSQATNKINENDINNDMINYTTVTRMLPECEQNRAKILPPSSTSPLDPSFTNIISGCAFNYCDSAASIINQRLSCKLKKSNSVASNQYFSQYMDKMSWSKNLDKKLREKKKLSRSTMDITKPLIINNDDEMPLNDTKLLQLLPPPPPIPSAPLLKVSTENKLNEEDKRDIYSFNIDGKLTKSSSTSLINKTEDVIEKSPHPSGVTYIKVDSTSCINSEILINKQIGEFRLDIEKQKLEFEIDLKEKASKIMNEILIDEKNEQEEDKEFVDKCFDSNKIEIDSTKEMQLKRLPNNLPKKTESFNYSSIKKTAEQAKKVPHSLAPFIIKSKQFFQQQIEAELTKQQPPQTANLKRNTSLPAKTLIRNNISQFYDIKSKIKQFESSCLYFNNYQNESNQQLSTSHLTAPNENNNSACSKIPEDFQSNVKVKFLKSIFETGNNNYNIKE